MRRIINAGEIILKETQIQSGCVTCVVLSTANTVLQTKRVDSENFEFRGYNHFTISK